MSDPMRPLPPVARQLGLSIEGVRRLIRGKQLKAVNVSTGTGRPTWRVAESELQRFILARQEGLVPTRRMRKRRPEDVIRFF